MDNTDESQSQDTLEYSGAWLVLIAQVPTKPDYLRVKLRRRIQRVGAVSLKGAVYVLPNRADTLEDFIWLRDELIGDGGDAIVCAARTVVGATDADLEQRFRELHTADYREIVDAAGALRSSADHGAREREIARLRRCLEDVAKLDFFGSPMQAEARHAIDEAASNAGTSAAAASSMGAPLAGRTWVTRAGVFVDRIASAWLIRRFIDRDAAFKFTSATSYLPQPGELRFDMFQAEYTHEGDRCTFETLLSRFGLTGRALHAIAEIVHDIDCKDDKFGRPEAAGVEMVLRGLVGAEPDDARRIERGGAIFDALLAQSSE